MYHISDRTNLKVQDKALKSFTSKYGVFGHKMLTRAEIKNAKTSTFKTAMGSRTKSKCSDRSQMVGEIWESFTVPVKFRIPSRKSKG